MYLFRQLSAMRAGMGSQLTDRGRSPGLGEECGLSQLSGSGV